MGWLTQVAPEPHLKFIPHFPVRADKERQPILRQMKHQQMSLEDPKSLQWLNYTSPQSLAEDRKPRHLVTSDWLPEKAGTKWQSGSDYNVCDTLRLKPSLWYFCSKAPERRRLLWCDLKEMTWLERKAVLLRGQNITRNDQVCGRGRTCVCAFVCVCALLGRWRSLEDTHIHTHAVSSAWDDSHAVTSG